jgi:hypothetical protein
MWMWMVVKLAVFEASPVERAEDRHLHSAMAVAPPSVAVPTHPTVFHPLHAPGPPFFLDTLGRD